ncbi:hypothetical protein DFJ58DRAFT_736689 [Suillus subalutaceus]|uniref:uncharacterized protein n=1 Tax=Suillus subalutaceus TaxID=48586 RepID=UPI001B8816AA|nr:uncharacterized protein DFJ58DRAFT_736689 [Suillus subalutaceus]KAG1831209.1 hypothetical protein DFJ58DRAFT_736689 [Suillus subalutaceus]
MDTDDNTSQPYLPILLMPSQLPHKTTHGLTQFLLDPDPSLEDFAHAQQFSLPIITSPPRIRHQMQNTLILTGDESPTAPNAGVQPQPYHTTDPTFIFPVSTPSPSQAQPLTTHIPSESATTLPAAPAGAHSTQTSTFLSDAAPIGLPSDTGKKRTCESEEERLNVPAKCQKVNACNTGPSPPTPIDETVMDHQNGQDKHQQFQSKCAAKANNIGGSSTTWRTGCK